MKNNRNCAYSSHVQRGKDGCRISPPQHSLSWEKQQACGEANAVAGQQIRLQPRIWLVEKISTCHEGGSRKHPTCCTGGSMPSCPSCTRRKNLGGRLKCFKSHAPSGMPPRQDSVAPIDRNRGGEPSSWGFSMPSNWSKSSCAGRIHSECFIFRGLWQQGLFAKPGKARDA